MSTVVRCDGCQADLTEHAPRWRAERANEMVIRSRHDVVDEWDWCRRCARIAVLAVRLLHDGRALTVALDRSTVADLAERGGEARVEAGGGLVPGAGIAVTVRVPELAVTG